MKLLLESTDRAMLLEKAALLQSKGIPVHVDDIPHAGAVPSHLYVVLDRQIEDARSLLVNGNHPVAEPVFDEDLALLADEVREVKLSIGSGIAERLMIGLLIVMAVSYIGVQLFD